MEKARLAKAGRKTQQAPDIQRPGMQALSAHPHRTAESLAHEHFPIHGIGFSSMGDSGQACSNHSRTDRGPAVAPRARLGPPEGNGFHFKFLPSDYKQAWPVISG